MRLGVVVLVLMAAGLASAKPAGGSRPLPPEVLTEAPGIHPFGKGRHSLFGIPMYDATLWIVGPQWSESTPHALDVEPNRDVSADTLIKGAIGEMRTLKVGDEVTLAKWQAEMKRLVPNLRRGDQVVLYCSDRNRTVAYRNESKSGEVDDPTFCPAVMSVWLHPKTKNQALRKSLLGH